MLHPIVAYPLFLPSVGPMEIAIIFTVVLILFGPGKLPEVFRALGDGIRQFKDASRSASSSDAPPPAASSAPALPNKETP